MRATKLVDTRRLETGEEGEKVALPDGILLKVEACGLTDTDLKAFRGELSSETGYLGSQIVGTIQEVGEKVSGYIAGERIMISCHVPCGSCGACRNGRTNECVGKKTFGLELPGGLSGEISISGSELEKAYIVKLPNNLKFEEACAADVAAAVFKSHRLCGIEPGMKILVLGCGPAGCMHTHLAKLRGADVIIQSDIVASRMEMARPFMADYLLNSVLEDLEETVKTVSDGLGVDVAIVATDNPEALGEAIKNVAVGGKILLFSRFGKAGTTVPTDLTEIQRKQITLIASDGYTKEDIQEILWLTSKRKITLKWLVTSVIDPDEIEKKIDAIEKGKELRVVVHP